MTKTRTIIIDEAILEKAMLETVYWIADCEYEMHKVFSKDRSVINPDTKEYQNLFYKFTNKYSVRRTLLGKGQGPTNSLLSHLYQEGFIAAAIKGEPNLIDQYNRGYRGLNLMSLLSKFATLIKADYYAMYDGNACQALSQLLHNETLTISRIQSTRYSTYEAFFKDYKTFRLDLRQQLNKETTSSSFWQEILYHKLSIDQNIITEDIFLNRLADKYLWCYASHLRDK